MTEVRNVQTPDTVPPVTTPQQNIGTEAPDFQLPVTSPSTRPIPSVTIGGKEFQLTNEAFSVVDGNQLVTGYVVDLNARNDADQTDRFSVKGVDPSTGKVTLYFNESGKTEQVPLSAFTQAGLTVQSNENGGYFISTGSLNSNTNISYFESKSFNYIDQSGKVQYAPSYTAARNSLEQEGSRVLMYNEANHDLPVVASVYQNGKWVSEGAMSLDGAVKKYGLTDFDLTTEGGLEGADNAGALVVIKECIPGEHPEPEPEPEPEPKPEPKPKPEPEPNIGIRTNRWSETTESVQVTSEYLPTAEPIIPEWSDRLAPLVITEFKVKLDIEIPARVDSTVIVTNPDQNDNLTKPKVQPDLDNPRNASSTVQSALKGKIVPLQTFKAQAPGGTSFNAQTTALETQVIGFNFGGKQSVIVIAKDPNQHGAVIDALKNLNPNNLNYIQGQDKPLDSFKTVLQRAGLNPDDFLLETISNEELTRASGKVVTKKITLPAVKVDAGTVIVGPNDNTQQVGVDGIIRAPGNSKINNTSLTLGKRVTDPAVLHQISASDPLARYILDMNKEAILKANPQPDGFPVYNPGEGTQSTNGRKPQTFDGLYPKK